MRHPIRGVGARLIVLLLAALVAAPQASAAPVRLRDAAPDAATADWPLGEADTQVQRRGHVVVSDLVRADQSARAGRDLPRLPWRTDTGPAPLSPSAPVTNAAAPGKAATTTRPPIVSPALVFDGLAEGGPFTDDLEPPDPWVAVGPDHVVQVVNVGMRITDRQGLNATETSLASFFGIPPGNFNADPRVIYDSMHNRWIAIEFSMDCLAGGGASNGHGFLDVAISDTADPRGGWTTYFLRYVDVIPDYPGIGTSADKVALSGNVFEITDTCDIGGYLGTTLEVLDWGQLKAGGNLSLASFQTGPGFTTIRPGLGVAPSATTDLFAIVGVVNESSVDVGYFDVTGNVAAGTATRSAIEDLTTQGIVHAFGEPPEPRQPGSPPTIVRAVDGRPTDAITWLGDLFFVSTTGCMPDGDTEQRACVRVSEIFTDGGPSLIQDFLLGEPGFDLYMGGIGLSVNGGLHVTYTRSSATEFASSYAVYQLPGDPPNAVSAAELVRGSATTYLGDRWGDYAGVAQDPQDPNGVWQTNEVPNTTGTWQTHISPLSTAVGTTFVPITPLRVLDTRPATRVGFVDQFRHGHAAIWDVAGVGPIPEDAVAVTGNVTVVGQTGPGFVSIMPRGTNTPTSSTINFPLGDVRANNITTALGSFGSLSGVYISSPGKRTHVIFDVTGYFVAGADGSQYNPLTPARIFDTRPTAANRLRRDVPRTFQIAGLGGVPAGAAAVTGNVTVAEQTGAGVISLTPTPQVNPSTSSLNFPVRDNRANGVTVPLSPTGTFSATYKSTVTGARTHLIFDVTGYYLDSASGLSYFPLNPGRRMDTRETVMTGLTGRFQANSSRTLDTAGHLGVPLDAAAVTGNLTVTKPTRSGYLALTPHPVTDPLTSTLNFPLGDTRANGITQTINASGDMSIWFDSGFADGRVHAILDVTGYFR